jgi:hypothetical protein
MIRLRLLSVLMHCRILVDRVVLVLLLPLIEAEEVDRIFSRREKQASALV